MSAVGGMSAEAAGAATVAGNLERVQQALRAEQLPGWLFYNVFHRDHVADAILDVAPEAMNTRPWLCLVRADGGVQRVVHTIEPRILDHLPGARVTYGSRRELLARLRQACTGLGTLAVNSSDTIPALSLIDHGAVEMVQQFGLATTSAANLIHRVLGVLDAAGRASHQRAATAVRATLEEVWQRVAACLRGARPVTEGEVRDWIAAGFAERGLVSDELPLVAVGRNSSDPHYQPAGAGCRIAADQVLQFDLWAKEPGRHGVYADISWVAYTGAEPPPALRDTFAAVCAARDGTAALIRERLQRGLAVTGAEVDRQARALLERQGLLAGVRHRTGHAIDTNLHGIGVNLDAIEFPDARPLLDGSCFSIEPAVYLEHYGMRSEINALVTGGELLISGGAPQTALLTVPVRAAA